MTLRLLCAVLVLALAGCTTLRDYTVTKRSAIDKEIATARAETETRLKALGDQQLGLLQQVAREHEAREQAAADYLFKGLATSASLKTPTRPEMVMGQSIQQTAAQLPPATAAAQAKAFQDLKTELDEARITTEALRAQYEKELGQARAEGVVKDATAKDLAAKLSEVDKARTEVLAKANANEARLSDARKAADDMALAAKTKEAEDAKATQAIRTKLSAIVGGLALLCLAGAIWSPVWKEKFGAACALLALIAVGIWWVQPWHIAIVAGLGAIALGVWAVKNHYIESKTASSVYHAIQAVKDTAGADYDRLLKPHLEAWLTTYTKDGKTVPDAAAIAHVDSVLMQTGAK